jgi:hypothetical protein
MMRAVRLPIGRNQDKKNFIRGALYYHDDLVRTAVAAKLVLPLSKAPFTYKHFTIKFVALEEAMDSMPMRSFLRDAAIDSKDVRTPCAIVFAVPPSPACFCVSWFRSSLFEPAIRILAFWAD